MIIAEAGTNWARVDPEQRLDAAERYARAAKVCEADVVKFQIFVPYEPLFCPMPSDEVRREWWSYTFMELHCWERLKSVCDNDIGIEFMASVFQPTAVDWLNKIGVRHYKVASRAAATFPYDRCPGPFIISNGFNMTFAGPKNAKYLSCVSKYPTPLGEARWPGDTDGLSDHSGTPWPAMDALARGAESVEVHFNRQESYGPDEKVSLSLEELAMVCDFREALREMRA